MSEGFSPDSGLSHDAKKGDLRKEYDPAEQQQLLDIFSAMLKRPTADGGRKRQAGTKVPWTVDPEHEGAMFRHLDRWCEGERHDPDSGAHPLIHVAWRALALAYQESAEVLTNPAHPDKAGDC